MPRISATTNRVGYDLIGFDSGGVERSDDPHGVMSDVVLRTLADDASGITDVFLLNHGWMGDIPAARTQYDAWVGAMSKCEADLARMKQVRPGFKSHVVGIHWPSLPWGDESFGGGSFAVSTDGPANPVEALVEDYATRVADTPKARDALRRIANAAIQDVDPDTLSPEVVQAYRELNWEADLGAGGTTPGSDRSGFDPQGVYEALREDAPSFGIFGGGGIFGVLRTLSFWRMKDRARWFGETTGSTAGPNDAGRPTPSSLSPHGTQFRVHRCLGYTGRPERPWAGRATGGLPGPDPGAALSIWSFCDDIPNVPGQQGYFRKVVADGRVRGPVLSTQSVFDTATGKWYPLGAGIARQVAFAAPGEMPKYGAVGTHGIRGPGTTATDMSLLPWDSDYKFTPGSIFNLECSEVIRNGTGSGGAHSDICHPEVAHAVWQAALAAP